MADDEYQSMSDHDFNYKEDDRRQTRVIISGNSVTSMCGQIGPDIADEITDGLQNVSLLNDSDFEDNQLKDYHNETFSVEEEDVEDEPVKISSAKKEKKKSKVAIVKPINNTNVEKMPSDNTKQKKTRARKEKKVLANNEEECPTDDFPSTSVKQTSQSLDLISESCSVYDNVKALLSPELRQFMKSIDEDKLLHSDKFSDSEQDQAESVVETKPTRAQTKKVTKGTAKTKMVKTEKLIMEKDQDDIEGKQEEINKKGRRGKTATTAVLVPNISDPKDKHETAVKMDEKPKNSRKVAKGKEGEPETQNTQDLSVEVNKTKNNKHVQKVVPISSDGNSMKRGKRTEEQANKESENYETSSDSKVNGKPSRNRKLTTPNDPNSVKENKTTSKQYLKNKKELEKNEMETNELTADDIVDVSPLPEKGTQVNLLQKGNKLKDKQPLKELNTAQEVKPVPKRRNVKTHPQVGDIQEKNKTTQNIPATESAPKKRNMKRAPQIDTVDMEPVGKINLLKGKNVPSNTKENVNDKEENHTSKPRKGANKVHEMAACEETAPEETAPRRTTRKRK